MQRILAIGALSGLAANLAVLPADRVLGQLISDDQKMREQSVREGSPHHIGGRKIGERLLKRKLSAKEQKVAQLLFTVAYGLGWGMIYSSFRRAVPKSSRLLGLPFATGFYFACDGVIAPTAKLSPSIHRIPWQFNANAVRLRRAFFESGFPEFSELLCFA